MLNTELYCLVTSDNTIFINDTKFRDYEEIKDKDIKLSINYKFAKYINNNLGYIKTPEDINHCYYWGFSENTDICINNDVISLIDIIKNPDNYEEILGIVEISSDANMYSYKGVCVSGNTLVLENNLWIRVFQSDYAVKVDNVQRIYNIIMADNIVKVLSNNGAILFRDFIESSDDNINDEVDKIVENRLNLMFNFDSPLSSD